MPHTVAVTGAPFDFLPSDRASWLSDPTSGRLHVIAHPHSDIFVDPGGDDGKANSETLLNAATLLADAPEGDFQLSARVSVKFADTFDAGVLLLWFDEKRWGKLCFEFAPDRQPMVVSVINRDVADDANAFVVAGNEVWLRMSRVGRVFAFHASLDGEHWQMVRIFVLDSPGAQPRIGFEAQSPMGEGCDVEFNDIEYSTTSLKDLRDGS
ncbi:hypothetical protein FHX48_002117 [Microbacterium halimionae]|uniref:DUF1349 domain-containing protein n=1 Tax=Microbacterium halimionae TaxID=1526413 RepID=A0A7W3JQH1_9MICO|nr:DUF1349 domain-containing protein [Microbacterium halimionae]MBA8817023.1 hypothetical protein [Microbacterium halimionae]NII94438.1 hypothetical protein [Microbacterium halimionae]